MSRETLRVTLVQTDLVWHDPAANRSAIERLLAPLAGKTDVVVLPLPAIAVWSFIRCIPS
jgi:hypothetical protein